MNILGKGVCDPHIRIFENKAYLYATHDLSSENKTFVTQDWWIWSSDDLINWKHECTLKPEDTYIGEPIDGCWATDAIAKNGKYYWYFSEVRGHLRQIGVVVADHPAGPWKDPLGKPMIKHESWAEVYDPAVFLDNDGAAYIVFGAFDYYIARLNEDMVSLAEAPKKLDVINAVGPYGNNQTDDKAFLHKRGDYYYLSWGCFYAMSHSVYGPYEYKGAIISEENMEASFLSPTWPHGVRQGRHGSFFEWNNQWYFTYCDMSRSGNRFFRDSWISYVYYKDNGEIAPIIIDPIAVGKYDAASGKIPAANFFKAVGARTIPLENQVEQLEFGVQIMQDNGFLIYPNILNIPSFYKIGLCLSGDDFIVEIRKGDADGELLDRIEVAAPCHDKVFKTQKLNLKDTEDSAGLCFVFSGKGANQAKFIWFQLGNS